MAAVKTAILNSVVKDPSKKATSEDVPIDLSCHNRKPYDSKRAVALKPSVQLPSYNAGVLNAKIEESVSGFDVKKISSNNDFSKSFISSNSHYSDVSIPAHLPTHFENRTPEKSFRNSGKIAHFQSESLKATNTYVKNHKFDADDFEKSPFLQMVHSDLMQQYRDFSDLQHLLKTINDDTLSTLFAQLKFSSFEHLTAQLSITQPRSANHKINSFLSNLLSLAHLSVRSDDQNCRFSSAMAANTRQFQAPTLINFSSDHNPGKQERFAKLLERIPTRFSALEQRSGKYKNEGSLIEHSCSTSSKLEQNQIPIQRQNSSNLLVPQSNSNVFSRPQTSRDNNKELLRVLDLGERKTITKGNSSHQHAPAYEQLPHTISHFKLEQNTMVEQAHSKPINFKPCKMICAICGRNYATEGSLTKHMKMHENPNYDNSFKCKICKKTCSTLGALRMHIRTHTLPCECHICGKAFSRTWLLQGHIRTHTGEKPYKCPKCSRAFADRSNLRAHMQTHEAIKRYGCQGCDKTFSRISLLKRHQRHCHVPGTADTKQQTNSDVTPKNLVSP